MDIRLKFVGPQPETRALVKKAGLRFEISITVSKAPAPYVEDIGRCRQGANGHSAFAQSVSRAGGRQKGGGLPAER